MIETPAGATRVLVVDDEPSITDLVSMALRYEQFDVRVASNGREALDAVESFSPDLAVLDIMMPGIDGFEVARRLRNQGARLPDPLPHRARRDRGQGPRAHARRRRLHDQAVQRRGAGRAHPRDPRRVQPAAASPGRLAFADLELDEDTHEVWRAGREIELTATEFKLLRYLLLNARRVLSKDQILDHVWNYDFGGNANIVETYVSYLRRKVDADGAPLIHTVRGVGYSLRLPEGS